jgi:hypothetical protein
MFLSRLLSAAEKKHWPTELEVSCLVWVVRKIRHMIEAAIDPPIVYTDYNSTIGTAAGTTLTSSSHLTRNLSQSQRKLEAQHLNSRSALVDLDG